MVVENGTGGLVPRGPIVTVVLPLAADTKPPLLKVAILAAMEGSYSVDIEIGKISKKKAIT